MRLKTLTINPATKRRVRGTISANGAAAVFSGRVDQLQSDYGFVVRDGTADRVYLHVTNVHHHVWTHLERNVRISFGIGFNFWGAAAIDVSLE